MNEQSNPEIPGQETIAALRAGLTTVTRLMARQRGNALTTAELSQHLLALQDLLNNLEQELRSQALEQDELQRQLAARKARLGL